MFMLIESTEVKPFPEGEDVTGRGRTKTIAVVSSKSRGKRESQKAMSVPDIEGMSHSLCVCENAVKPQFYCINIFSFNFSLQNAISQRSWSKSSTKVTLVEKSWKFCHPPSQHPLLHRQVLRLMWSPLEQTCSNSGPYHVRLPWRPGSPS